MKNRGRLTAAEKAGDQIGSGHSFLQDKCNVVTVTPILTKKGEKRSPEADRREFCPHKRKYC
ncbi:hypothetical protein CMV52_12685 [Klebsiella pneumoniae]|nr:hypothetical protein CQA81_08355 [Klebsiella pneumoniae]RJK62880.1 hypothetical protein CMV62_08495 [Klebsiella pneumoniae]RJK72081.1 hypothetical protein CMV52_12685 [Klebsiella pneumoniae]RJK81264.1 hypothetical protein CMV56_06725 [Klebsiella pneumoniae]